MLKKWNRDSDLLSEELRQKLEELGRLGEQQEESSRALDALQEKLEKLDLLLRRVQIDVKMNRKHIREKSALYDVKFERNFYQGNFDRDFESDQDFSERFLRLVRGLDHNSAESVIRMLHRRKIFLESGETRVEMFSREEQERIAQVQEHFRSNVMQLSDSLYYYNGVDKGYFLPKNYFTASVFMDRHGIDLVENLDAVRSGEIIDAGAFIGDSALILSPLTDHRVHSFEAVPENFSLLKRTIELNHLENVVPVPCAVSCRDQEIQIHQSRSGSSSSLDERSGVEYVGSTAVQAVSIDSYVQKNGLKVSLIKSDVEGAEQQLLEGALETIREQRPVLLISIYHNESDFFDIKPKIESLNLGYKFRIAKPSYGSAIIEAMLVAEVR